MPSPKLISYEMWWEQRLGRDLYALSPPMSILSFPQWMRPPVPSSHTLGHGASSMLSLSELLSFPICTTGTPMLSERLEEVMSKWHNVQCLWQSRVPEGQFPLLCHTGWHRVRPKPLISSLPSPAYTSCLPSITSIWGGYNFTRVTHPRTVLK